MEQISVDDHNRFAFGDNWTQFLSVLDESRILQAEKSLQNMLAVKDLKGKTFLDIGSGSGLFSLAARRLGAKVYSFDYDPKSVACTLELKRRYFNGDGLWSIDQGSVLDQNFMNSLDKYDIVYSWGVLHHTGQMWNAIKIASHRVDKDGLFYLAIYNDQGLISHIWWVIKYFYNRLPRFLQNSYALCIKSLVNMLVICKYTCKFSPMTAIKPLLLDKKGRGMSWKHDMYDWIGGYPFEFSSYDVLEKYLQLCGFDLVSGKVGNSAACHEMIFKKTRA